ncbi:MAG TPA: hypothetical protein VFL42_15035 [Terriglobales bacterium]|nr:hypothetical protein [Terriglobales bacterium]
MQRMLKLGLGHYRVLLVSSWLLGSLVAVAQTSLDSDGDGLRDDKEQALLEKFRPTFMISATDCSIRPARFEPDRAVPKPVKPDGTIYGQVFPIHESNTIEIHYYTLWSSDCGRIKHPLDAEHVSVLVVQEQGTEPRALYWYAGAHEGTACDISSGARANAIGAEDRGPSVWSSSGKHALYLRKNMCSHGCGADFCEDDIELAQNGPVINLGELNAPANGSLWITSPAWPLSTKMDSDFPATVMARLDATSGETVATLRGSSSVRGTIQGSGAALDGAGIGAQHTAAALDTANGHTSRSLGKATKATGRSLRRAWNAVFHAASSPE